MKIINNVLISITDADLVGGVFRNEVVTEVADKVFFDMRELKAVDLPNCKKTGNYNFHSCAALTSVSLPNVKELISKTQVYISKQVKSL
jgi:hypothetical protein